MQEDVAEELHRRLNDPRIYGDGMIPEPTRDGRKPLPPREPRRSYGASHPNQPTWDTRQHGDFRTIPDR